MAVQDYKINYKSDFVLNINGDAGWAVPFCIKFWTGIPSQAYFVGFDGVKYVNCRVGDTPTQLLVMFDDHHLPIGPLRMQIAYHTTIEEFPGSVFDEVTNARDVIVTIDGTDYQVLLDFTGEDAPELEFDLPAYANEAERIQNELQRQQNEADRIEAELQREQATTTAVQGAENVNAQLNGTTLTVTNRQGVSTSVNTKGEQGEQGPVGPEGPQGETGISIVSFLPKSETATTLIYTITFSNGHTQDVAIPKGPKGDTGATGPTGPQGPQGDTGVSITGFVETGETETATLYNITFSNGTTQQVAIPKGEKGDTGEQGPVGPQGPQGPMGDVAVITTEQQSAFTMYSITGQHDDGPMTQKAVTDALVDIGKECGDISAYNTIASYGIWNINSGTINTRNPIRAHLKIAAKNKNRIRVIVPPKYAFSCAYVNDSDILVETIYQSWQEGDVEFNINGEYDIMLNIKYDTGTSTLTQAMLNNVLWNITLYSNSNGYESAAPYGRFKAVENMTNGYYPISIADMTPIPFYINAGTGVWTSAAGSTSRIYQLMKGQNVSVTANTTLAAVIAFIDNNSTPSGGTSAVFANKTQSVLQVDVGTTKIFHVYEDCKLYVIYMTGTPNNRFPTEIKIKDAVLMKYDEGMKLPIEPYDVKVVNYGSASHGLYRVQFFFDTQGKLFSAIPKNSGYQVAYATQDAANNNIEGSGWTNGFIDYKPSDNGFETIITTRKTDDSIITIEEILNNIDIKCVCLNTSDTIKGMQYRYEYQGEEIRFKKRFDIVYGGSYPATVSPTQGMAISGQYCVQGSSTESNGMTKAELIDMSTRTSVANLLLDHTGYSAIHCNIMCFGKETPSNGIMPALYASQWDGQTCCFVFDVKTTGATLLQVIEPSLLTKDGVRFGAGNVDWVVDTDHDWLFAISYKESGYMSAQIITKFNLPKLSDGSLVQLTDEDIIAYNTFGDYIIRQDGCYYQNRLYLSYGSPNGATEYQAIHVIDVHSLNEVSTLPMTFLTVEPEGLDVYQGELMFHLIGQSVINKLVFN